MCCSQRKYERRLLAQQVKARVAADKMIGSKPVDASIVGSAIPVMQELSLHQTSRSDAASIALSDGTAPPPYSQLAVPAVGSAPAVPVPHAVTAPSAHSTISGRLRLPDGAPIIAIPQKISYSMSPLVRAYPPSLGLKYGIPRTKWLEFLDVTSAYLAVQTPLKMLNDVAYINSTLGKDPTSSFVRTAGRGVEASVIRTVLSRHLQTWNADCFAEKGLKAVLITGAMLDGLLGTAPPLSERGCDKADLWEKYAMEIKGRALSGDWEEITALIQKRDLPSATAAAAGVLVPSGGAFYEKRVSVLSPYIEPFESMEPITPLSWLSGPSQKAELVLHPITLDQRPRPAMLSLDSSASTATTSVMADKCALKQQYKHEKRELKSSDGYEKSDKKALKRQYKLEKRVLKYGAAAAGNGADDSKKVINERITRASCIWLIVLPFA